MNYEKLKLIGDSLESKREKCSTEEATKTALILPFIKAIGYDIFNPDEVVPELIADVNDKKGEKIDYALKKDGAVIILIECKKIALPLGKEHTDQLKRYFPTLKAKLAILTNGEVYKFYTDLDAQNVMDDFPFFEFNIKNLTDESIKEITKISKNEFNINNIKENAKNYLYYKGVKEKLFKEFDEPSTEFIDYFARGVYQGPKMHQKVIDSFKPLICDAIQAYYIEKYNDSNKTPKNAEIAKPEISDNAPISPVAPNEEDNKSPSPNGVETTAQELEAFDVIKFMLHKNQIDIALISYVDTINYFAINFDGKPFCRLSFGKRSNNNISLLDKQTKKWVQIKFDTIHNLYELEKQIVNTIK